MERIGSGLESRRGKIAGGSSQTALSVNDHGLFYFAARGSETVRRYKNISLYLWAVKRSKIWTGRISNHLRSWKDPLAMDPSVF
jgi:hypothetical protein